MDSLVSGCFEAHRDGDVPQWGVIDRWHGGGCEAVTSSPGPFTLYAPCVAGRQRLSQVENQSVVDGDLVSRAHGPAVTRQALSIRDVAAENVQTLGRSVVGRHSYPDTGDVGTFRDFLSLAA
jgi:hypothetical protein